MCRHLRLLQNSMSLIYAHPVFKNRLCHVLKCFNWNQPTVTASLKLLLENEIECLSCHFWVIWMHVCPMVIIVHLFDALQSAGTVFSICLVSGSSSRLFFVWHYMYLYAWITFADEHCSHFTRLHRYFCFLCASSRPLYWS